VKRLTLWARSVLPLAAALTLPRSLLPVIGMALVARWTARAAARARRTSTATVPVGMGRFHCAGYRPRRGRWTGTKALVVDCSGYR
jgi:hypothetical protein